MSNENQVLVTALVDIEHDREKHIPGTKSATFLMPESSVDALVRAGAIKVADVVDADHVLATSSDASGGAVSDDELLADLRSQVLQLSGERNDLLAQLSETQAVRDDLAGEVQSLQAQLEEANAKLAGAHAAGSDAGADTGSDTGAVDAGGDAVGAAAEDADPAAADAESAATTTTRTTRTRSK